MGCRDRRGRERERRTRGHKGRLIFRFDFDLTWASARRRCGYIEERGGISRTSSLIIGFRRLGHRERRRGCLVDQRPFIGFCECRRGGQRQSKGDLCRFDRLCFSIRFCFCLFFFVCFPTQTRYRLCFNFLLLPFRVRPGWAQLWAHFHRFRHRTTIERRDTTSVLGRRGNREQCYTRTGDCRGVARNANFTNGAASVGCRGPEKLLAGIR